MPMKNPFRATSADSLVSSRISFWFSLISLLLLLTGCGQENHDATASEAVDPVVPPKITEDAVSKTAQAVTNPSREVRNEFSPGDDWTLSADKSVALKIEVDPLSNREDVLTLWLTLQNRSTVRMYVMKPLGDDYAAYSTGLQIVGPMGKVRYQGKTPGDIISWGSFVELEPRETFTDKMELSKIFFPDIAAPGEYRINFTYLPWRPFTATPEGMPEPWIGQIKSKTITVVRP